MVLWVQILAFSGATIHFNPWRGCTKVSPGCANCYAETLSKRNPAVLGIWGDNGTRVVASESQWREPLKWEREAKAAGERHRVFCASLADVFEDWDLYPTDSKDNLLGKDHQGRYFPAIGESVEPITLDDIRARLFSLIHATPNLDWLLLTKRPQNVMTILGRITDEFEGVARSLASFLPLMRNVWVGTTVENQKEADWRIDRLLEIPAAVRFLSVEPMLGPINLTKAFFVGPEGGWEYWGARRQMIQWVICGGESGAKDKARPFDLEWARSIRDQCREGKAAFFMKQFGSNAWETLQSPGGPMRNPLSLRDSHGGDWDEWPSDLRVREFPRTTETVA